MQEPLEEARDGERGTQSTHSAKGQRACLEGEAGATEQMQSKRQLVGTRGGGRVCSVEILPSSHEGIDTIEPPPVINQGAFHV